MAHHAVSPAATSNRARAAGQPLRSLELADGLIRYSERGQEYVDTLKGIIRVNGLDIADDAVFRDEPLRFSIGAEDAVYLRGAMPDHWFCAMVDIDGEFEIRAMSFSAAFNSVSE